MSTVRPPEPPRPDASRARRRRASPGLRRPGRLIVAGFGLLILLGALVLTLPVAHSGPGRVAPLDALFTATSAVCVTGLAVVDTVTAWSTFGQVTILVLIQVGGFGVMTLASVLALLISRRIGLGTRLLAAAETKSVGLGEVRSVVLGVARISLVVEASTAVVLAIRFATAYDQPVGRSLWLGVFHAVSAFNNAGFALFSDNLIGFATDPWICLPIALAVIIGGLGFPVILELLRQHQRPRRWSLHTKITLAMTAVLLVGGTGFVLAAEWANPGTLGPLDTGGKLLAGFFQGVMPRTAGFNSVDIGALNTGTLLGTDILMFIGGGSAGTAGGIKVATFAVLMIAIYAEVTGDPDVTIFDRRMSAATIRQAMSVALLSVAVVTAATLVIAMSSPYTLDQILYEVISAFATVGLSTGITADLAPAHQLILVALMYAGRLGPITLASALVLRESHRLYRRAEGRPLIG